MEKYILEQDIIYVGGGNTRNMLVLWKEWGLDSILKKVYEKGIIHAGLSAESICWFEEGLTDPLNAPLHKLDCLSLLKGSHCPHYKHESIRRPAYQDLISKGQIIAGYAVENGAALHFINGSLHIALNYRTRSKAHRV